MDKLLKVIRLFVGTNRSFLALPISYKTRKQSSNALLS